MGIGAIIRLLGELLGFVNRRTDLVNTEAMKKAATAQKAADERSRLEKEVADKNEEQARKDFAE